jgi:pectate lyase
LLATKRKKTFSINLKFNNYACNNYFNKALAYDIGSAYGAKVFMENNYFERVHLPKDIRTCPAKSSGSSSSYVANNKLFN